MKTIHKLHRTIFFFSLFLLLLQACSILGKRSTFTSTANPSYMDIFKTKGRDSIAGYPAYSHKNATRWIYSETDFLEANKGNDTQKSWMRPHGPFILIFESSDSTFFLIEEFAENKLLLAGPPFIPFIPIFMSSKQINENYLILIKLQSDTVAVTDLKFYKNKEEIIPELINEIKFSDSLYRKGMYIITENNSTTMFPQKYYLFTFNLKKRTTKEIKIRKKEEIIFHIKRKQKWEYVPFDFTGH